MVVRHFLNPDGALIDHRHNQSHLAGEAERMLPSPVPSKWVKTECPVAMQLRHIEGFEEDANALDIASPDLRTPRSYRLLALGVAPFQAARCEPNFQQSPHV